MKSALLLSVAASAAATPVGYVTFLPIPGRKWGGEVKGGAVVHSENGKMRVEYQWLASDRRCDGKQEGRCSIKAHSGSCKDLGVGLAAASGAEYRTDKAGRTSGAVVFAAEASVASAEVVAVYDSTGAAIACGRVTAEPTVRKNYPERVSTNAEPPRFNFRRTKMHLEMKAAFDKCEEERRCPYPKSAVGKKICTDGKVTTAEDTYDCKGIDLMSFVPAAAMGEGAAHQGNDIWGWEDPDTGREIAIHCLRNSASFIDVTDPEDPQVLAWLPGTKSETGALQSASWRDVKVFNNTAYFGADSILNHGVQVFDLTRLSKYYDHTHTVVPEVEPDFVYNASGIGPSHNIVINEETGFMYAVGSRSYRGGPHILDLNYPHQLQPKFVAGFDSQGYTHDAQVVVYRGPDKRYEGREIYFGYNEDHLTILDVTDKDEIKTISKTPYRNNFYTHQGWLTEDQSHLLLNDELDEQSSSEKYTRTLQWSVEDLENPELIGSHIANELSIDHNLYIWGDKAYMSNYCSGLRVLDVSTMKKDTPSTPEIAFFDMAPYCDTTKESGVQFSGTWSNYMFPKSGHIIVNSIEMGLFVLKMQDEVGLKGNLTRRG